MATKNIKLVVVGDGAVGKTCLLYSYAKGHIPSEYNPTVFDNQVHNVEYEGQSIALQLWDTAGQEELENIRCLSYSNTNIFLLCYSVTEPNSYENVQSLWLRELREHCQNPLILLVGTKVDLRTDHKTLEELASRRKRPLTHEDGRRLASDINAVGYVECSSVTRDGNVNRVFQTAIKHALKPRKEKKGCILL